MARKKKGKTAKKKASAKGANGKTAAARKGKAEAPMTDGDKKRIERAQKALSKSREFTADRFAKQLTETLLDEMKALESPWYKTPQKTQEVIIARTAERVRTATGAAVRILAATGHAAVICNLVSVTFKDGVKGTISVAPGSDMRHQLADHATKDVVLVLADPQKFLQGLEDIKADLDQPELPL